MLEVIAIEEVARKQHDYELEAFGGWQRHLVKAKKPMDFDRYKRGLGITKPGKMKGSKKKAISAAYDVMKEIGLADVLGVRPTSHSQPKHSRGIEKP